MSRTKRSLHGWRSVEQACEALGVSRATLYRMMARGLVEWVQLDGERIVRVVVKRKRRRVEKLQAAGR
jgi:excisionase family DNA binding protein